MRSPTPFRASQLENVDASCPRVYGNRYAWYPSFIGYGKPFYADGSDYDERRMTALVDESFVEAVGVC